MDQLKEIFDFICEIWNQISVWLPASAITVLLIIWRIAKTFLSIINSKKEKVTLNFALEKLQKEAEDQKKKLTAQIAIIQKYNLIMKELIESQINPVVKSTLISAFNELHELELQNEREENEKTKKAVTEDPVVVEGNKINTSSGIFVGD